MQSEELIFNEYLCLNQEDKQAHISVLGGHKSSSGILNTALLPCNDSIK